MKKVTLFLNCLLFVLILLYPVGVIIFACLGYTFELISVSAFAITISILSVCVLILNYKTKAVERKKTVGILASVLIILSLIGAIFCLVECSTPWEVLCVFLSVICVCFVTMKFGKPLPLKISALVASTLLIITIGLFGFFALVFEKNLNTVVKTVESPTGKYYAEVINNDQGALGGYTFIEVQEKRELNAIVFKIKKKPKRVYEGHWGAFKDMKIFWKDDNYLVINSVEYFIE